MATCEMFVSRIGGQFSVPLADFPGQVPEILLSKECPLLSTGLPKSFYHNRGFAADRSFLSLLRKRTLSTSRPSHTLLARRDGRKTHLMECS